MNQNEEILRLNRLLCGLRTRHERMVAEKDQEIERLQKRCDSAYVRLARYQREHYRLRRIEVATGRLQETLKAKEAALSFSIKRQEVLRRKLTAKELAR